MVMRKIDRDLFPSPLAGEGGVGGLRPPFLALRTPMLRIGYSAG